MTEVNMGEASRRASAAPPMRPDMRAAADPRDLARQRAAEIMGNGGDVFEEGSDQFYFDRSKIPDGWDYEWKRHSIYGKEDPPYVTRISRTGWTPVPASRHPEEMPSGYKGATIERDGQMLYERPLEITVHVNKINNSRARFQVQQKEEQLSQAPQGTLGRDNHGAPLVKLHKSYEAIKIPD